MRREVSADSATSTFGSRTPMPFIRSATPCTVPVTSEVIGRTLPYAAEASVFATEYLNGKKVGESLPDQAFFNAIMRIWIGTKPVDSSLKPKLLWNSEKPASTSNPETN